MKKPNRRGWVNSLHWDKIKEEHVENHPDGSSHLTLNCSSVHGSYFLKLAVGKHGDRWSYQIFTELGGENTYGSCTPTGSFESKDAAQKAAVAAAIEVMEKETDYLRSLLES